MPEGLPSVIPPEMATMGWQESVLVLAQLVKAEILSEAGTLADGG